MSGPKSVEEKRTGISQDKRYRRSETSGSIQRFLDVMGWRIRGEFKTCLKTAARRPDPDRTGRERPLGRALSHRITFRDACRVTTILQQDPCRTSRTACITSDYPILLSQWTTRAGDGFALSLFINVFLRPCRTGTAFDPDQAGDRREGA